MTLVFLFSGTGDWPVFGFRTFYCATCLGRLAAPGGLLVGAFDGGDLILSQKDEAVRLRRCIEEFGSHLDQIPAGFDQIPVATGQDDRERFERIPPF